MDCKYTGIVLGKYDVGETDRIYIIYTKESGKIRVLASGARKPQAKLAGNLEPLTQSEIFIAKRRGMGKITGAIASNNFPKIKSDLDSLQKTFFALKKMEKFFPEEEKDEKMFELLVDFLETMEKISAADLTKEGARDIVALGFVFNLLSCSGYQLETGKCVRCGGRIVPENNYFSAERGGVLCGACHPAESRKIPMSGEVIKLIRIFLQNEIKNLVKLAVPPKEVKNLQAVANETVNWITN